MDFEKVKADFNTYFVDVLKTQYVDFTGRANRTQFWMFNLFAFIIIFAVTLIAGLIHLPLLTVVASAALLLPALSIGVRRIRDLGISGWLILIALVPFVGGILVLIGYCLPTDSLQKYAEQLKQIKK